MYRTIVVQVDVDDPPATNRITLAAHLAADCRATLIGVAAALPSATIALLASGGAAAVAGTVVTGEPDDLNERFAAAQAQFVRSTSGLSITTGWRTAVDFPAQAIADSAARADLIVVGPARRSSAANSYMDYGELVMRAGRPVLVVPQDVSKLDLGEAVVAWRNTRESRRALVDALPLLAVSGAVTLLHVDERSDDGEEAHSLADAAAFLEGHSIAATTKVVDAGESSPAQRITEFAADAGAGLIVSGAYGHTRLREWAFGGVTHDLLAGCPIPCVFSR